MTQKASKQQKLMLLTSAPSTQSPRHQAFPNQATTFISVFTQMKVNTKICHSLLPPFYRKGGPEIELSLLVIKKKKS